MAESSYDIGEHFEKFVADLVASGRYFSRSDVLRDALHLLEDAEIVHAARRDELNKLIEEGLADGETAPEPAGEKPYLRLASSDAI